MAVCAIRSSKGRAGRGVHRVIGGAVVGGVAAIVGVSATRREAKSIVAVSMALRALDSGGVHAGQRETGVVVVER